jgi:predicted DNA-binding transcriptional regulator AlpA
MKSIIATDGHERYTFVIILSGSGEQHIAGLVYNTKSFKLGAWNDHLKDKDGNPLPTTASLLEASQVSQALGSLSFSVSQLYNYWSTTELPKRLALRAQRN